MVDESEVVSVKATWWWASGLLLLAVAAGVLDGFSKAAWSVIPLLAIGVGVLVGLALQLLERIRTTRLRGKDVVAERIVEGVGIWTVVAAILHERGPPPLAILVTFHLMLALRWFVGASEQSRKGR
jgi:hypothetical protein